MGSIISTTRPPSGALAAATVPLCRRIGPLGYGQADAGPSGLPVAGVGDTVEWKKHSGEGLLGDAGAVIANTDDSGLARIAAATGDGDLHFRPLGGVADGVSHHVLDPAPKHLLGAVDDGLLRHHGPHGTLVRLGLEIGVGGDRLDEGLQGNRAPGDSLPAVLQPCQGEELPDQVVEPFRLALDPVQRTAGLRTGPLPGQLEGDAQPGQRGAQLVRDVAQQVLLGGQQLLDPLGHQVEVAAQGGDLVAAPDLFRPDPRRQVASRQPLRRRPQSADRGGQMPGESEADQSADDEGDQRPNPQAAGEPQEVGEGPTWRFWAGRRRWAAAGCVHWNSNDNVPLLPWAEDGHSEQVGAARRADFIPAALRGPVRQHPCRFGCPPVEQDRLLAPE